MKLALSGRIVETEDVNKKMMVEDFIKLASSLGYQGVELRSSQINSILSEEEISLIKKTLDEHNVGISFLTNPPIKSKEDFELFKKDVELTIKLGTNLLRVDTEEVNWLQKCCDYLSGNNINLKLFFQMHTSTLLETIEGALEMVKKIDRSNFGLSVEPGNFVLSDQDYSEENLRRISPFLFNVQFQNIKKVDVPGKGSVIKYKGNIFQRCLLDDPRGIDIKKFFNALKAIGYDGWVTVIEPISELMDNTEMAKWYYREFKLYI